MTPRRLTLVAGDRAWDVALTGGGRVELDGEFIDIIRGPAGTFRIVGDGGQVLAHAVADGPRIWVHVDGEVHVFETATPGGERPPSRVEADMLSAPMPATVREVRVAIGDAVTRGDVLVMLEAMKMELPVRAPHDGVVRAVRCAAGELVQPGAALVELA